MSNDSDGATVICARKTSDGKCGIEIELIEENLKVMRPSVPLLCAICPECGYSNALKKDVSIQLVDEIFGGSVVGEDVEVDPMAPPSDSIADKVISSLALFGYEGKKWNKSIKVIKKFVSTHTRYQNKEGLAQLLATMKIDAHYIPLVADLVFGEDVNPPIGQFGVPSPMGQLPTPATQFGSSAYQGYPQYQMNQGMPGGQQPPVIVMPSQPTQSVVSNDDGVTVEETVKNGEVVKRIIKQKAGVVEAPKSEMDSMIGMVAMMKELGVIGNKEPTPPPAPAVPKEVLDTLSAMSAAIAKIGDGQNNSADDRAYKRESDQRAEVRTMADKLDTIRNEHHAAEMDAMRRQMDSFEDIAKNGPKDGLNDNQFKVHAQSDNLKTVTCAIEGMGEQIVGPLVKLQTMQAEMSAMMMMRNLEGQDGVANGTYSSMVPNQEVPEEQVVEDLQKWKKKADGVKNGGVNKLRSF